MEKELLRLFKSYLGKKRKNAKVSKRALEYGLLIPESAGDKVIDEAIKQYGKDGSKWNLSFHKSFDIVATSDLQTLVIQQLVHYITTYGFENLGIYDSETVYIPKEELEIPVLANDVELIVINAITEKEVAERLMNLLTSGIALAKQTVEDIMVLADFIDKDKIDQIKNREVKLALYKKFNIMPKNPDEFFRYLLLATANISMKIKNNDSIAHIKYADKSMALKMLKSYLTNTPDGYNKLASIFLRNKDLFLAFKVKDNDLRYKSIQKEMNAIINKLRKLADNSHRPVKKAYIDSLTDANVEINTDALLEELDKVTVYREIRALNSILYKLSGCEDIVYKIRNGSAFVKKMTKNEDEEYINRLNILCILIRTHLVERLSKVVKGKTVYIPENVVYAAPTSEKKYYDSVPEGSYITISRTGNLVYGIYWKNLLENGVNERVDLDLKQMNQSAMFGWDASYRSDNNSILFSGDMTDASGEGASELFYVKNGYKGAFLVTLNNFTMNDKDVPVEFVIANADKHPSPAIKHVLDPNDILTKFDFSVLAGKAERTIGLIVIDDEIKFYFNDLGLKNRRTARNDDISIRSFNYLQDYNKVQLKLNDLLEEAGAIMSEEATIKMEVECLDDNGDIVNEVIEKPVDYNLSLEAITKDNIINIFKEN